jgi:hypothetical protein
MDEFGHRVQFTAEAEGLDVAGQQNGDGLLMASL